MDEDIERAVGIGVDEGGGPRLESHELAGAAQARHLAGPVRFRAKGTDTHSVHLGPRVRAAEHDPRFERVHAEPAPGDLRRGVRNASPQPDHELRECRTQPARNRVRHKAMEGSANRRERWAYHLRVTPFSQTTASKSLRSAILDLHDPFPSGRRRSHGGVLRYMSHGHTGSQSWPGTPNLVCAHKRLRGH